MSPPNKKYKEYDKYMSKVTEEQIENVVNKAGDKITKGVLDSFVQILDYYHRCFENENHQISIKEICLTILTTEIVNCTNIMKETLKDLLCE